MTSATYQTRVPSDLIPYCEAMGFLFGEVERHLYKALEQGEKLNTLKKEYQIRFGINARQFNSVYSSIKGKIESLKECRKRHIKELAERIKELEKTIKKFTKRLRSIRPACGLKGKSPRKLTEWKLHQKKRKLALLQHKLGKIKTNKPSLIFDSNGILGVDLNPGLIGWAVCDKEGNLQDKGQIRLNLNDRSTEQIKATLGDAVKQLVDMAGD